MKRGAEREGGAGRAYTVREALETKAVTKAACVFYLVLRLVARVVVDTRSATQPRAPPPAKLEDCSAWTNIASAIQYPSHDRLRLEAPSLDVTVTGTHWQTGIQVTKTTNGHNPCHSISSSQSLA